MLYFPSERLITWNSEICTPLLDIGHMMYSVAYTNFIDTVKTFRSIYLRLTILIFDAAIFVQEPGKYHACKTEFPTRLAKKLMLHYSAHRFRDRFDEFIHREGYCLDERTNIWAIK